MEFLSLYAWRIVVVAVFSYLIGSFSFAVIFTKLSKKQDVREMGSGNAGFTNVLRCVGVGPAVLTFVFDCIKGILSVLFAMWLFSSDLGCEEIAMLPKMIRFEYTAYGKYIAGLFCVIGHSYPIFFGFRGGKGIVTFAGVLAMLDWRLILLSLGAFLVLFIITRIISVGSLAAATTMILWNYIITYFWQYKRWISTENEVRISYVVVTTILIAVVGVFVVIKHRANIKRLIHGEEKKIAAKKN